MGPWLAPAGRVIASVANVAHWAVIAGLLDEGRSGAAARSAPLGGSLRHFTRGLIGEIFEACGYAVESVEGIADDPPPDGRALLATLASLPGASPDLAVLEWVVVARLVPGPL